MTEETHLATALSCAGCTLQLTRFQAGLLAEADSAVVRDHLAGCPDCRVFADQLEDVADFFGSHEPRHVPASLSQLLDDSAHGMAPADLPSIVRVLSQLAHSLDAEAADDLVQQTLLAAFEGSEKDLRPVALARDLVDRAFGDTGPTMRTPDEYATRREFSAPASDSDGDTAELFYPEFYDVGPDAGGHIDTPNSWGGAPTLSSDDDVRTAGLYDVVDDAIARLPDPLRQLVQFVDIDGFSVGDAAEALSLRHADAVDALHRARVHLRGVVDRFVAVGRRPPL